MKKFHIAIGVVDIDQSVQDYSARLGQLPQVVINGEYALWRTDSLNFSIRKTRADKGAVRHIGWEDSAADGFSTEKDVNGIIWERFNEQEQLKEIASTWPEFQMS